MKLSYYPGCTLKNQARNFEEATWSSMERLGVEMEELDRWNCCGTVYSLSSDDVMRRIAPVRNLVRAREMGSTNFMTSCAMCYNTTKRANLLVQEDADVLRRMNEFMYTEKVNYEGDVEVTHTLEFLRDKVTFEAMEAKVTKPLTGLRVASYYGCLLVRPKEVAFDDVENPRVMEDLISALGAEPVDFPLKTVCCAAYQTVDKPEIVADQTYKIITSARNEGAEMIVVTCPLCAYNLDHRQELAVRRHPEMHAMPIVYFTQLMALAMGCEKTDMSPKYHYVNPNPILAEKGLIDGASEGLD